MVTQLASSSVRASDVARTAGAIVGVIAGNIVVIGLVVLLPLIVLAAGAVVFGPTLFDML